MDTKIETHLARARPLPGEIAWHVGPIMRRASVRPRPWWVSAAGAIGAVALQMMFLSAFTLGASTGKPPRPKGGAPEIEMPSTDDGAVSVLIFVDPRALAKDDDASVPALRVKPPALKDFPLAHLVRLSGARLDLVGDGEGSQRPKATADVEVDGAERAMLFGRYVSQINARIERLWVRPQSAPSGMSLWGSAPSARTRDTRSLKSAATFRCRVQILQSREGEVLEVTLLDCDRSPKWEQSLVNAIDAASPLPAPPDESVFARSLVLNFTSAAGAP